MLNNRKFVMELEHVRSGKARIVLDLMTSVGHTGLSVHGDKIPPGCHCIWSLINLQCHRLNGSLFYLCIWLMVKCGAGPETGLLFTFKANHPEAFKWNWRLVFHRFGSGCFPAFGGRHRMDWGRSVQLDGWGDLGWVRATLQVFLLLIKDTDQWPFLSFL